MLLTAFAFVLLVGGAMSMETTSMANCPAMGTAALTNTGTTRFAVARIETLYLPYAIDQCSARSLTGGFVQYTCESDGRLTRTEYEDAGCTTMEGSDTWEADDIANISMGAVAFYYCGGSDDWYTRIMLTADSSCDTQLFAPISVAVGSNVCVVNPESMTEFNIACDTTVARLQYFVPSDTLCSADDLCSYASANQGRDGCDVMLVTEDDIVVRGYQDTCVAEGITYPETTDPANMHIISVFGIVVALLFSFFAF